MLNPRLSITVNGERLQMVFVDFRYAYNKGVCGIDDTRNDIMQQVEECAKKLKREDYQRVVLVRLIMQYEDEELLLKIARLFEEEDIEVACIYSNKMNYDQYVLLTQKFDYGVVSDLTLMEERRKEEENKNSRKKTL